MAQQGHFSDVAQDNLCDMALTTAVFSRRRNRAVRVVGAAWARLLNESRQRPHQANYPPIARSPRLSPLIGRGGDDEAVQLVGDLDLAGQARVRPHVEREVELVLLLLAALADALHPL